jgi:hypothetical protein
MLLYEAAIACRAYTAFGGEFDDSFREFVRRTGRTVDLESEESGSALMKWLNEWGCRQFAKEFHSQALTRIRDWARQYLQYLPDETASFLALSDGEICRVAEASDALQQLQASLKRRTTGTILVHVGATGAAKILYALRPNTLPPWDDPIRNHLNCDGSAGSYARFLRIVIAELQELLADAANLGVKADQLPSVIGRGTSTLPKIADEYFWVTITRGFKIPTRSHLRQWSEWSGGAS